MKLFIGVLSLVLGYENAIASPTIDALNQKISSGNVALDYVIQNVCVDANDKPIAGDPAYCAQHRNIRIGEKAPYIVTDLDRSANGNLYQALFSYPVPGVDGTLKILVSKNMQGGFNSSFRYDFYEHRDGYDLLDASGAYISGIRTSDPGCYDQKISHDAYTRQNGWIFFNTALGSGSITHNIMMVRLSPNVPAACAAANTVNGQYQTVSQTFDGSVLDIWNAPTPVTYESGKVLQSIVTYHAANTNLGQTNNAIEKYFFTREYGFTRWEAWIPRNRCYAEGKWFCNDPDAALWGRCGTGGTTVWGNQYWVRTDCRDSTNYIALATPQIPAQRGMAYGDIDIESVFAYDPNRIPTSCRITQSNCPNSPSHVGTFTDPWFSATGDANACMQRASDFYNWCGKSSGQTMAEFIVGGAVQQRHSVGNETFCRISQDSCPNYGHLAGSFNDTWNGAASNPAACMQRAADYYNFCGKTSGKTTAEFIVNGAVQQRNAVGSNSSCRISQDSCPAYPSYVGSFNDSYNGAAANAGACMQRAHDYYSWCGKSSGSTTAEFISDDVVQQRNVVGNTSCRITQDSCPAYPSYVGSFNDGYNGAGVNAGACMQRAHDYYSWCGKSSGSTTAEFISNGAVQQRNVVGNTSCRITQDSCPAYPSYVGSFNDNYNGAGVNAGACMQRAHDYYSWCGKSSGSTTAEFISNGAVQNRNVVGQ